MGLHEQSRREPIAADERVRSVAPPNSLRLKLFYQFLPQVSAFFRRRRMQSIVDLVKIEPGTRVLDLGGTPEIWEHVSVPLHITLLNLPGANFSGRLEIFESPALMHHSFVAVEGDALNVEQFGDHSFDLVFSNSVIEHVGPPANQARFAHEVRRLGKCYWVQTPSKWFPIEAHTGVPFYWLYPEWVRGRLQKRWREKLPSWWSDYIEGTRVLSLSKMTELFPDGQVRVEYFMGLPKSYISYARERLPKR